MDAKLGQLLKKDAELSVSLNIPRTVGVLRAPLARLLFEDESKAQELHLGLKSQSWRCVEDVDASLLQVL